MEKLVDGIDMIMPNNHLGKKEKDGLLSGASKI
jgi:hypothetical protein